MIKVKKVRSIFAYFLAFAFVLGVFGPAVTSNAASVKDKNNKTNTSVTYTRDAVIGDEAQYPGVYRVSAVKGDKKDSNATIGISSIAKQNLVNGPTFQSPAIIMGAAVPYEEKTGPTEYTQKAGGSLYAPYSYFRYKIIEEANPNGAPGNHKKMSGFDGSYVIVRVDVSDIIKDAPAGSYLHVKQEGNKALMANLAYDNDRKQDGMITFSDAGGNMASVYKLDNNAASLKDLEGNDKDTPYVDVIVYSSGNHVAGADAGSTDPLVIKPDFALKFYVDQTDDYNPELIYDPNAPSPTDPDAKTHVQLVMEKYFDETKIDASEVTSYTVMGSDLELEVMNDDDSRAGFTKPEYWSMHNAMTYDAYDNSPIKMICEVPVLEGLRVEGTVPGSRNVILDVNSFDIQIANHQETGAAGLTVKNATLKLMDGFNTTGAELAVGNNATMSIEEGGKLIVDATAQLEVEYDAASTAPAEGQDPAPTPDYDCGVIAIKNGGEIENNGVITVEGTEGKPVDPANPSTREIKNAEFHIAEGGKLTNNGCLLSYGSFYNMGTIVNNGKYDDVITSNDPDKGSFTYHKGIQISWKDDVTQDNVTMGSLYNGKEGETISANATLENSGDIVLVPGILENYGKVTNTDTGNIYPCVVEEAVIPVNPTADKPTTTEKRIKFGHPIQGWVDNELGATFVNEGTLTAANVEIVNNGRTGALTADAYLDPDCDIDFFDYGTTTNKGSIRVGTVYPHGTFSNYGEIVNRVIVSKNEDSQGMVIDYAETKLDNVYNAKKRVSAEANIWEYTDTPTLTVSPKLQECKGGETAKWNVKAELKTTEDIKYLLRIVQASPATGDVVKSVTIDANTETEVEGPVLPQMKGNVIYGFFIDEAESGGVNATVKVTPSEITPPVAIEGLQYAGKDKEQELVTKGNAGDKALEYCVEYRTIKSEWTKEIPKAIDAGLYKVHYRIEGEEEELGAVEVTIQQRLVIVSANDVSSKVGEELKDVTNEFVVSGLAEGDTVEDFALVDCKLDDQADKDVPGEYPIYVNINDSTINYTFEDYEGIYRVVDNDFDVTAKDKYGVYSDDIATYKGYNIEVTAPQGATVYYSAAQELNINNYETAGFTADTFKPMPAAVGKHAVYYFVISEDKQQYVSGKRYVVIDKAAQTAPDKITTEAETWKGSGDGLIMGLTPRAMEFRNINNEGAYTTAYYELVSVPAGTYLVRMIGDENHYPSPDTKVVVGEGPEITVEFDSAGGSEVAPVTGLTAGDILPRPDDPVYDGHTFDGWYFMDSLYDFSDPVTQSFTLTAKWTEVQPDPQPDPDPDPQPDPEKKDDDKKEDTDKKDDSGNKDEKTDKPSNEWIDGKYYDANGVAGSARAEWKSDAKGWWFEDQKGWYPKSEWQKIDGLWYYFDAEGYMAHGEWIEGYWLDEDGAYRYTYRGSWKQDSKGWWFDDESGWYAQDSWQKIDGKWYFFQKSGYMATLRYIEEWWVDADGVCQ